jgi:uncharacterized protein (TIGR03083 family)
VQGQAVRRQRSDGCVPHDRERVPRGTVEVVSVEVSTDQRPDHPVDWYVEHLVADAGRVAAVIDHGDLAAQVAACPGWDVRRLVVHLGVIHRWARHCALHAAPPADTDQFEPGDHDLGDWFRAGADDLVTTLRDLAADAPTWHPFPTERVGRVWPRRLAHETSIHRWDLQAAVGDPDPIDPELASDGIDEYFEIAIPRLIDRAGLDVPRSSFHVHCTDIDGEWLVWNDGGDYRMKRAHEKGDAALRGPAEAILLRLWGRTSTRSDELSPVGDESAMDAWLSVAGM